MSDSSRMNLTVPFESIEAYGVSDDGQSVNIATAGAKGELINLVFPVSILTALRGVLGEAIDKTAEFGSKTGERVIKVPVRWDVGSIIDHPLHLLLRFDQGLPSESTYMVPITQAFTLAEAMKTQVVKLTNKRTGPSNLIMKQ